MCPVKKVMALLSLYGFPFRSYLVVLLMGNSNYFRWMLVKALYMNADFPVVKDKDLYEALENTKMETIAALKSIPVDRESYAYAEGKWTVKQLAQHVVDCERILNYRALAIARKEPMNLNGFDENLYVENDYSEFRTLTEICEEFEITRNSTQMLIKSFHPATIHTIPVKKSLISSSDIP